jgi:BirA family biotin operon repressor/biotin-[acetyl-CoA-carboxylase] ligase
VSILLRPARPVHEIPVLSLAGGIAAVECARAFGADARLSWPNDVVCEERKLGGVLAELGPEDSVLLGVGMNLSSRAVDLPAADRLAPTSLLLETGSAPTAPVALAALLEALQPLAALFDAEGPAAIAARARPLDALSGSAVQLRLASGEVAEGTASGIADDGSLLVRVAGEVLAYASGEVVRLT